MYFIFKASFITFINVSVGGDVTVSPGQQRAAPVISYPNSSSVPAVSGPVWVCPAA